jgi:hypothetical protein
MGKEDEEQRNGRNDAKVGGEGWVGGEAGVRVCCWMDGMGRMNRMGDGSTAKARSSRGEGGDRGVVMRSVEYPGLLLHEAP